MISINKEIMIIRVANITKSSFSAQVSFKIKYKSLLRKNTSKNHYLVYYNL